MKRRTGSLLLAAMLMFPSVAAPQQPKLPSKAAPPAPSRETLTPEARAAVESRVREVVQAISAAARNADAAALLRSMSERDGLCLFGAAGATASPCSDVWASFRKEWNAANPDREARQEFEGEQIKVTALTPTLAVATWTMSEDRGYRTDGRVKFRASVADLLVFVLENGEWKLRAAQQAVWPITNTAAARAAIEQTNHQLEAWYRGGRIDSVAAYFDEGARQMPPGAPPLVGRDAIRDFWTAATQWGSWDFSLVTQDLVVSGELAAERGTYATRYTPGPKAPRAMSVPTTDHGNYVVLWKKAPDGVWRIVWDAPVSDVPPAAAAPSASPAPPACQVEGVWELVSRGVDGVSRPAAHQRKFIARNHWVWVITGDPDPREPVTVADSIRLLRNHVGGSGTYTVEGTTYTETPEYFPDAAHVALSIPFSCRVEGDRFYQSGDYPVIRNGKKVGVERLEEVYRRIE